MPIFIISIGNVIIAATIDRTSMRMGMVCVYVRTVYVAKATEMGIQEPKINVNSKEMFRNKPITVLYLCSHQ